MLPEGEEDAAAGEWRHCRGRLKTLPQANGDIAGGRGKSSWGMRVPRLGEALAATGGVSSLDKGCVNTPLGE